MTIQPEALSSLHPFILSSQILTAWRGCDTLSGMMIALNATGYYADYGCARAAH